jgi:hypothetical protein
MAFTPVAGYHWLLAGAALALCVLIVTAAWPSRRRLWKHRRWKHRLWKRRLWKDRPARPLAVAPSVPVAEAGSARYWVAAAAAALVLALVGGPVAIAVPAVMLLGWWRRHWVPWLAFTAMCVAGVLIITALSHGAQPGFGPFGWPAQAAALIALAAALVPPVPRPPSWQWPGRASAGLAAEEDAT